MTAGINPFSSNFRSCGTCTRFSFILCCCANADSMLGKVGLNVGYSVTPIMHHRCDKRGVGMTGGYCFQAVLRMSSATGCDYGYLHAVSNGARQLQIVACLRSVPVHAG